METVKIFNEMGDNIEVLDSNKVFFIHKGVYNEKLERDQKYTICAIREEGYLKIGIAVCRLDENFVKAKGRNEAAKRALEGKWTFPSLTDDPRYTRNLLYLIAEIIDSNFNYFKRTLTKPKK